MQSFPVSHESSLHFSAGQIRPEALQTDPRTVALPPHHPDTDLFRYTYARYHDRMRDIDQIVGRMLAQLEEDGLLDDTFVFYFGDHGGVLPGSKGYLSETGLHIPLVVRVPENWKHLSPLLQGSRVQGFVSFVDFGPTLIHLAGAPLPDHFDGRPFLGQGISADELNARDETFGYADRFDEKYDLVRSLRKGRFKYHRNYQAFYPDGLQNNYRYRMLAYQQWRERYRRGQLNEVQRRFFESKPVELLFDVQADPYETRNLADDTDLALLPFDQAAAELAAALRSDDPWKRYWALIACSCFGEQAASLVPVVRPLLDDPELLVRVRAAEMLGILGVADPRPALYQALEPTPSPSLVQRDLDCQETSGRVLNVQHRRSVCSDPGAPLWWVCR